ncbi:MAG: DUF4393 domain-containing protein [Oscillospiraceae bacterium]|nr:DUF4393 domain-containing protein [Oscillospiraceae bacterium]
MDDKMLEVAKEAVVAVAKEGYQDAAKPVLEPTGKALGLLPRAIKAAFLPLEKWIIGREYNLAETEKLLEQKLQNVSLDKISSPEAYIGVPALQYISYCVDSEELRDMYAELLAKSMNEATRNGVHPSFVEIIKQLCPDEARIMKIVDSVVPVITVRYENRKGDGYDILRNFSNIGEEAGCEYPYNIPQYLDNMERLGIISTNVLGSLLDKSVYAPLKNHPSVKALEAHYVQNEPQYLETVDGEVSVQFNERYYYLTDFGRSFKTICITPIS